jgi:putative transposase
MITAMHATAPERSIRRLCTLTGVGRTWCYTHPAPEMVAARDVALRDAIEQRALEVPGYGHRRMTKALQRAGWDVNHKRVLRVMREEALLCQLQRHFAVTTQSDHGLTAYPNLLTGRDLTGPDQAWVADLTYIRLPTTFVYLACLLDAWSRRCLGWHLSRRIDTSSPLAALDRARTIRRPTAAFIHHSDRGVQYASAASIDRLTEAGARISMSAVGNPYDTAKAERFFKTLQRAEVYLNHYDSFAEAEANLGRFIEEISNTKRLHASLGDRPPIEFETLSE